MSGRRLHSELFNCLLSGECRQDRLYGLLWPKAHPPLLAARRNELILQRIWALASVFAVLTLVWIPLDVLALPGRQALELMALRIAACGAFAHLAATARRRSSLWWVYRNLAALYAVPTVFYFASLLLLRHPGLGPYARIALQAYWALPAVAMAGLGVFPLTLAESAAFALPIVAGEAFALSSHLGVFFPGGILDAVWMMFLMGGIAVVVGISQLSFAITLVSHSQRDALTGCYSRKSISDLLELHFKESSRLGTPLAVAFLDLDHFKQINDLFGHQIGDGVLVAAARSVQAALHGAQCVGRWGGEEFLILFPGKSAAEAIETVQRIRAAGLGHCPESRQVTVSVGVAERIADRCSDGTSLVRAADLRMYAIKNSGRDRVCGPEESRSAAFMAA
jgi:diguanylate cyclase (GGDEF)-like protein